MTQRANLIKMYLQKILFGLSAFLNILIPIVNELHGGVDKTYILGFNVIASLCIVLGLRTKEIGDLIDSVITEVKEIKGELNSVNSARSIITIPNAPQSSPRDENEDNEPMNTNVVQMNAYYYKDTDEYTITPRPAIKKN